MSAASATAINAGRVQAGWTITELWVAAIGIGGGLSRTDIERIGEGRQAASPLQHDILATALNEHFIGLGQDHPVTYWADLPSVPPLL